MAVPGPYTPQNMAAQQAPQSQPMSVPASPQTGTQKTVKRGTSKVVPIVMSAGLAIGTFSGLLFGLGTGEASATTPSNGESSSKGSKEKADKTEETPDVLAAKVGDGYGDQPDVQHRVPDTNAAKGLQKIVKDDPSKANAANKDGKGPDGQPIDPNANGSASATGSGTGSGSGSGSGVIEAKKTAKITVEISPANVAATAKVSLDGKDAPGGGLEIPLDPGQKKTVDLVVNAQGFHEFSQKVTVESDTTVKVELIKKPVVSAPPPQQNNVQQPQRPQVPRNTNPPPPTSNGNSGKTNKTPKPPQGGIIDI